MAKKQGVTFRWHFMRKIGTCAALLFATLATALFMGATNSASPQSAALHGESSVSSWESCALAESIYAHLSSGYAPDPSGYTPYNTPQGAEVRVDLDGGNFLVFSQVDVWGNTFSSQKEGADIPGFSLLSGTSVEITTTSIYRGRVLVNLAYGEKELTCPEENLVILQLKDGYWEDITVWMDPQKKLLTGEAQSLGIFAVGWVSEEEGTYFYFSEGYKGERIQDFLAVENPSRDPINLTVKYLFTGEPSQTRSYILPPRCRLNINMDNWPQAQTSPSLRVVTGYPVQAQRHIYFDYVDLVETSCYPLAESGGLGILSPLRRGDTLGIMFHQASTRDIHNLPVKSSVMIPYGRCLSDANPWGRYPGWTPQSKGNPEYWIQQPRGRGTYSTSAVDVGGKAGCPVYAPVDGVVESVESYNLYGAYPDVRISIIPEGHPGLRMILTHIDSLTVKPGDRVRAGVTRLATVRPLHLYFRSDIGREYTGEEGDHVHLQVNLANGG